jgi:RNA polymerase sigma factor (sigma-70 family)
MAETHPNPFLHHIRHLIGGDPAAALTDRDLLERFLAGRDEAAVEVLVRRYGSLVLAVCRRVLRNGHAAEDVFQATFLVLVRKASLVRGERLGSWLYTVAYRLARRARAHEARRRQRETRAAETRPDTESPQAAPSDLLVALEEELHRLPARHRDPLELCYLEGKTNAQAAQILGCPPGSMSARLDRARERLRECLARRGFVTPAATLAGVLAAECAPAAVPLPLLDNTVRAALWFAGEKAAATGFVSARAVALARGTFRAMFVNKLKIAAAAVLAAAMLGTGATMLLKAAPDATPPARVPEGPGERLPDGALARMGTTHLRHGDAVSFAAFTPDGGLVTVDRSKTLRLWDLAAGKESRRFDWGEVPPDGEPEPSEEGATRRRERQFWNDTARSCQAALSADGTLVAASRGGVVRVWETASGKKRRDLQTGEERLVQLAFSADGASLLTLAPGGRASAVWELATSKCVRRTQGKLPPGPFAPIGLITTQHAIVSPGWKYLATSTQTDNALVWSIRDLATGKELHRIKPGTVALTFSADDRTLAWAAQTAEEGHVVVWDVGAGKELRRLKSEAFNDSPSVIDDAMAIALSADGQSLAVSWMSRAVEMWDLRSGKRTHPLGKVSHARFEQQSTDWLTLLVRPALAFSPDGKKLVASLGGPTVRQFRVDTGEEISGPAGGNRAPVSTLGLSADGKALCTWTPGDPGRCWDWRTGKETGRRGVPAGATHAAFAGEGRVGFAIDNDFTLCGPDGRRTWKVAGQHRPVVSLALSPDAALLATRNFLQPEVHLWDATTGKERFTLGRPDDDTRIKDAATIPTTGVLPPDLVFSPDGRLLAGAGHKRQLCLWDVATGSLVGEVLPQVGQAIERFAFSPGGHCLATVDADRTVSLYETATGAKRGGLRGNDRKPRRVYFTNGSGSVVDSLQMPQDAPVCLAFSPDGRYLATAQETAKICLWDVLAGREVGQLEGHQGGVVSLLFSPNGKHLFSGGTDTTVLSWDLTRRIPAERAAAPLPARTLDGLWTDLAGQGAVRAFEALRKLSASPDQAIALIKERLHPAIPPDRDRVAQLLAGLASGRFDVRRQAEGELEGLGRLAEPALRRALADDPTLDQRLRLEGLLAKLAAPAAAEMLAIRAVELLELLGGAEARQVLRTLAEGEPTARLTGEAARAVRRLTHRGVKP